MGAAVGKLFLLSFLFFFFFLIAPLREDLKLNPGRGKEGQI